MDNETKLSSEQIKSITEELITDPQRENINMNDFMNRHLNEKQKQAVSSIVSDPEKLRALLSSPAAQKLMNKLREKPSDKE